MLTTKLHYRCCLWIDLLRTRYGHHFRHMVWAGRGAQELLMKLVDDHYPMPPNPDEEPQADQSPAKARKRTTTTARGKVTYRRPSSMQHLPTA